MELQDNKNGQTIFQNQLAVNDFAEQPLHFKLYDISNTPSFLNLLTRDHSPSTNSLDHLLTPPPFINLENILEPIFITSLDQSIAQYTAQESDSTLPGNFPDHIIETTDHIIDTADHIIDTADHIIDTADHIIDTADHINDTADHINDPGDQIESMDITNIAVHELSSDSNASTSFENQSRERSLEEIIICEESDPDDDIVDLTQE